jgi:hypothetical protein
MYGWYQPAVAGLARRVHLINGGPAAAAAAAATAIYQLASLKHLLPSPSIDKWVSVHTAQ